MGIRTGQPRGRPKGARNKRTKAREAAVKRVAKMIEAAIPEAFQGDGHALLMSVYKDPSIDLAVRIECAKAALPFEKPRLSPVEPQRAGDDFVPLAERLKAYARGDALKASAPNVDELEEPGERDDRPPNQPN
jgi:hypothetical protein